MIISSTLGSMTPTRTWTDCVNAAITRTLREALTGSACRNLVLCHALNGVPLPEDSEAVLHAALAGRSLTVEFTADGFSIENVLPEPTDEALEPSDEV